MPVQPKAPPPEKPFLPTASVPVNNTGARNAWEPEKPFLPTASVPVNNTGARNATDPAPQDLSWLKPYEGQTLSKPYVPIENWVAAPLNPSVQWGLYHAGWEVEKPKDFVSSIPEDWLDTKGTRELTDYSYQLSANEYDRLQKEYGAKPNIKEAPRVINESVEAVKMTKEAYLNLTDEQRAAVDFNGLLVDAREADLANPAPEQTPEERAAYDKRVEAIFGVGNGAERVAENTLTLLENILKSNSGPTAGSIRSSLIGQDLDDFLSLEASVDLSQLKDFKLAPAPVLKPADYREIKMITPPDPLDPAPQTNAPPTINPMGTAKPEPYMDPATKTAGLFTEARGAENRALATSLVVRELDAKLTAALTDPSVIAPTRAGVRDLVFNPQAATLPLGFAPPGSAAAQSRSPQDAEKENQWLDFYTNGLMNPAVTNLDPLWAKLKQAGYSEEDIDEFWTYVDQFTKYEVRTNADRGNSNRRSAKDIRKLAGLEG